MIKTVAIFGLGYQGKQFIRFFLKNNYSVVGICKTENTKQKIEQEFSIPVVTEYKKVLDNRISLLVLCAYPIEIYEEVLLYSGKFSYKILADLPITLNKDLFDGYIKEERLFLFLQELKLPFFSLFLESKNFVKKVDVVIFQNKLNLKKQDFKKEAVLVDTHYALSNILGVDFGKVNISYVFVERMIKNIEYVISVCLSSDRKNIMYYEDGKYVISQYKKGICVSREEKRIFFDNLLKNIIIDIKKGKQQKKVEYFEMLVYLFKRLNYEKT